MADDASLSPQFGGECAFAVSLGKRGVTGGENCYLVQDGKKYLFSNPVAKLLWRILPGRKQKADANYSS